MLIIMKLAIPNLVTPIYLKLSDDMPWPEQEKVFYLLAQNGCFLCRNHLFFSSSVVAEKLPCELASHEPFLQLSYPKLAQTLFERVIGFFDIIGERHEAEAAVLLVWNTRTCAVEIIVPPQTSIVSNSWSGRPYPMEVHYEVPALPPHLTLVGDIHSHVDGAAYASYTDRDDEAYRPGLHIVIGRIREEPPEWYIAAVVDQTRFRIHDLLTVVEGYSRRRVREVPQAWLEQVSITTWSAYQQSLCQTKESATSEISSAEGERERLETWLQTRNGGASSTLSPQDNVSYTPPNRKTSRRLPGSQTHL